MSIAPLLRAARAKAQARELERPAITPCRACRARRAPRIKPKTSKRAAPAREGTGACQTQELRGQAASPIQIGHCSFDWQEGETGKDIRERRRKSNRRAKATSRLHTTSCKTRRQQTTRFVDVLQGQSRTTRIEP